MATATTKADARREAERVKLARERTALEVLSTVREGCSVGDFLRAAEKLPGLTRDVALDALEALDELVYRRHVAKYPGLFFQITAEGAKVLGLLRAADATRT